MADEKPKRQYNYGYAHKAKMASRKAVKAKEKEIAKLKKNLENKTRRLREKKETLKVVQNAETNKETKKGLVIEEDKLDTLPSPVKKLIEEEKERVVFKPNSGPQTDFLAAPEQDVLYGGSAGGGKSYAMLVDPLRFMHIKEHRALLLRKSMPELRELIDKSRELYPKAFKGAKFREVEKIWRFPSGASLEFGYLDRDADVYRYQGQSYTWIGIDELTQYPTEFPLQYLQSRLRTTNNDIQCYIRCTANPGGVGGNWVKKRYLDPAPPNESFTGQDKITRKFIPARLEDNPYLSEDGKYEQMLQSLPAVQRKQLLEGNWDVSEGAAFTEFDYDNHVVEPFELPRHWVRVKGIDYGYAAESAVVWAAVDPSDETLIVYRELYQKGLTGEDLATRIFEFEKEDRLSVSGVLDGAAWARTGATGPTVGEVLSRAGHKLRRADKNRIQGKIQIHERLKLNDKGRPKLQIFKSCPNLIREIQSIPIDPSRPEDVDTKASDHAYDALRYLIMSRPRATSVWEEMSNKKRWTPSDPTFGY
jgi:phage terminase large subunit